MRISEVLFEGVNTRFGLRTIEKLIGNPHFIFCPAFQNRRLGGSINFIIHLMPSNGLGQLYHPFDAIALVWATL
jgi:hypothetical protein